MKSVLLRESLLAVNAGEIATIEYNHLEPISLGNLALMVVAHASSNLCMGPEKDSAPVTTLYTPISPES